MKCPFKVKVCTKCKRILIACSDNFAKDKKGKYGFCGQCKICIKKYKKEWNEKNKKHIKEWNEQYYEKHKEEIAEKNEQYREEHKEEISEYKKQYYEEHKEEISEKNKQYREENPHIDFNHHNKRRQRLENQGRGITKEQWYEMFCFFDWKCAYSGEKLNKKGVRTIDHIIALDNGGLNEPWNCIPCYNIYNYNKHTSNMEQWYEQQEYFNEERLEKIYAWCEYAFDKWKPRRKGNKKYNK